MEYLSHLVPTEFLWAVRKLYSTGLMSWTETLDRLIALLKMGAIATTSAILLEQIRKWCFMDGVGGLQITLSFRLPQSWLISIAFD